MPRKTTGSTATRSKKAVTPPAPAATEPTPIENGHEDLRNVVALAPAPPKSASPKNDADSVPVNHVGKTNGSTLNAPTLDEEIRHRSYQLYLERNGSGGDPSSDWLIAEREVRARHATAGR